MRAGGTHPAPTTDFPLRGSLSKTSLHFVQRSLPQATDEVALPPYSAAADERMGLSTSSGRFPQGICFPSSLEGKAQFKGFPLKESLPKRSPHFVQRSSPEAADEVVLPPCSAAAK